MKEIVRPAGEGLTVRDEVKRNCICFSENLQLFTHSIMPWIKL